MSHVLKMPAIKRRTPVTLIIGFKVGDSTFHTATLEDNSPAFELAQKYPLHDWATVMPLILIGVLVDLPKQNANFDDVIAEFFAFENE